MAALVAEWVKKAHELANSGGSAGAWNTHGGSYEHLRLFTASESGLTEMDATGLMHYTSCS